MRVIEQWERERERTGEPQKLTLGAPLWDELLAYFVEKEVGKSQQDDIL